jgi:hypothetical protein
MLALWAAAWIATAPAARAQGACTDPNPCLTAGKSIWLGDLNNDQLVNAADVSFWTDCILNTLAASGGYCASADFNFDGRIDNDDLLYLNNMVALSADPAVGRLPKVRINETRSGKPASQTAPGIPQSRYVEFRVPPAAFDAIPAAPSVNQPGINPIGRAFSSGWYYLKVTRAVRLAPDGQSASILWGVIAVDAPISGMNWCVDVGNTSSTGLSLLVDGSFALSPIQNAVPPGEVSDLVFTTPGSLRVPDQSGDLFFIQDDNVTHLLVYRNPVASNPRAFPTVGQSVNRRDPTASDPSTLGICVLPFARPSDPTLPPWDVIVDAITVKADDAGSGCVFTFAPEWNVGPIGCDGVPTAPVHVYRCRTAGTLIVGPSAVSTEGTCPSPSESDSECRNRCSDTPFVRNPLCTTPVTGCGEYNLDCSPRSCFSPQVGGGCTDSDCCNSVCDVDPTCCCVEWDQSCADLAIERCRQCGTNAASCLEVHPTPGCEDEKCCQAVCNVLPECCAIDWDEACVQRAVQLCAGCGDPAAGPCDQAHGTPYCSDAACCQTVCELRPECCEVAWDVVCVSLADSQCSTCGAVGTGDCCIQHPTPYCEDGACCAAVCAVDPFCCTVAWDYGCTQIAATRPQCQQLQCACGSTLPNGDALSCYLEHREPGCTDAFCCQLVCQRDPYCCYAGWDAACVAGAEDSCANDPRCIGPEGVPVNGSCFIPRTSPGCDLPGCCSQVCEQRTECCDVAWDLACVELAVQLCDRCGDPYSGSCYTAHGTPNCADAACCKAVCAVDPFCCDKVWDASCADRAGTVCPDPVEGCGESPRSCWVASFWSTGCSDPACCRNVCEVDVFCCEVRWDAVCARQADLYCMPDFPSQVGRDGCLSVHASPGCAQRECSNAVCSTDPTCCTEDWDQRCVVLAGALCPAPYSCPALGRCDAAHENPGCDDVACCNGVCNADPTCCDAAWDADCATIARAICETPAGLPWNCPCIGDCFSEHDNPGCEDGSCCNIVCQLKPSCCTEAWDAECASFASFVCCGPVGCDSGCNGPCTEPHASPFCSDPYCCATVCAQDPLCCSFSWDGLCVEIALQRCASSCGMADAGNCFAPHDLPSCRDGRCCARVCADDPVCCNSEWDDLCAQSAKDKKNADVCVVPPCGSALTGPPCVAHSTPASDNLKCCEEVCKQDSYCCDTEWDQSCVEIARQTGSCDCSYECGEPCAGSCCRAHGNGGCDDAECCKLVCAQDAFCCDEQWDSVCAEFARAQCNGADEACPLPECGSSLLPSCCVPSPAPRCSDEDCCEAVCEVDPFCCSSSWDVACVQRARETDDCDCDEDGCGSSSAGDCFSKHGTPGCDDLGCCQTVCAFDPLCCEQAWDPECVALAEFFCTSTFKPLLDHHRGGPAVDPPGRFRGEPKVPPAVGPRALPRQRIPMPGVKLPERAPAAPFQGPRRAAPSSGK